MGEPGRCRRPARTRSPTTSWTAFIAAGEQRPKAPWHPFPLVELCVLAGIVFIIVGFLI